MSQTGRPKIIFSACTPATIGWLGDYTKNP